MLETMREYALEQLNARHELELLRRRHAQAMQIVLKRLVKERDSDRQLDEVGNIRAAMGYALNTPGEGSIALSLATDSAVVLATSGLVPEVLQNLLSVESFVTAETEVSLAAQYWQWVGRVGKDGRIPARRCVEVLARAELMFAQLGRIRRVHACRRQLAETHLALHDLDAAENALAQARELESAQTPAADLMRRLRLEGLLEDAHGRFDEALRFTQDALEIAERYGYRRYCYNLLTDRAWIQLQAGRPDVAERGLLELLFRIPPGPHDGLPRAEALVALLAARIAEGRLARASESIGEVAQALLTCGLLFHRGDIFAWLAAASGKHETAAQVLGAVNEFHVSAEGRRDRIAARAYDETLRLLSGQLTASELTLWTSRGRHLQESQLISVVLRAFEVHSGAVRNQ